MRFVTPTLAALTLTCLGGCVSTTARFTPYSSTSLGQPVVRLARVIYAGDIPTLEAAGAQTIGYVAADGNAFANYNDLARDAAEIGARYGGTHVYLYEARQNVNAYTTAGHAQSRSNVDAYGNVNTTTTYTPPQTHFYTTPSGSFVVIRVPPERWAELPPPLHPTP